MYSLCETARALIAQRTLSGRDMHGAPFQPYSPKKYYAPMTDTYRPEGYPMPSGGRDQTKSGRQMKSMVFENYASYKVGIRRPPFVQLSISNAMLGDMASRAISPTRGEIFFTSRQSAAKAHGHHTGANALPAREFFGLHVSNVNELVKQLADIVQELIDKHGAGE